MVSNNGGEELNELDPDTIISEKEFKEGLDQGVDLEMKEIKNLGMVSYTIGDLVEELEKKRIFR